MRLQDTFIFRTPILTISFCSIVFTLCIGFLHGPWLAQAPNGFHKWRESDTAAVASNLLSEDFNLLRPRIDQRGLDSGVTGMEFPIYNATVAKLWQVFGYEHIWARLVSLLCLFVAVFSTAMLATTLPGRVHNVTWAVATAFSMGFAPLTFFYAQKIQPDIMGLALSMTGFWLYVSGDNHKHAINLWSILGVLLIGLAGTIKPTFLVIGAPLALLLFQRHGIKGMLSPRNLVAAASMLAPTIVWLRYARKLSETEGNQHFYLGGDFLSEAAATFSKDFAQNVFLTWPFELQSGFILFPFAITGIFLLRKIQTAQLLAVWIGGCFLVFVMTAGHCATSHDYYGLPMVPPLAIASGYGIVASYNHWQSKPIGLKRKSVRILAGLLTVLALAPSVAFMRIQGRYGDPYQFSAGRNKINQYIPESARILAVDDTPSTLLYRVGRKGLNILPTQLDQSLAAKYDYVVSFKRFEMELLQNPVAVNNLKFLFRDQGIVAYQFKSALNSDTK